MWHPNMGTQALPCAHERFANSHLVTQLPHRSGTPLLLKMPSATIIVGWVISGPLHLHGSVFIAKYAN